MADEDELLKSTRAPKLKRSSRHFFNIHKQPDHEAKYDSNAELQRAEPNWYGPYLEEGERYHTERSPENVARACKEMGLDDLSEDKKGERDY